MFFWFEGEDKKRYRFNGWAMNKYCVRFEKKRREGKEREIISFLIFLPLLINIVIKFSSAHKIIEI